MSADTRFVSWEQAVGWLREQPDQAQLVRDAYYDDPLLAACERYYASGEWSAIRALLRGRTGTALDVGAGRGIASYALAKEGFRVSALEPDPGEIVGAGAIRGLVETTGLPIDVVEEFSERLPFANASFDVVFARAVLHHTSDLRAACREFFRVLKPGGIFVAVREHVISRPADLPAFLDMHPLHKLYGGEHAFLLAEYTAAIEAAGFVDTDVLQPLASPVNYYPHDERSLRREIAARVGRATPLQGPVRAVLAIPFVLPLVLRLMSRIDSRPGRLYSFVCHKPR